MKRCATALSAATLLAATAPAAAAPGDLDPSFSSDGFDTQNVFNDDCGRDVAVQADGKVVAVGSCDGSSGPRTFSVMRYAADGSPDQDFGTDGVANVSFDAPMSASDERAYAVVLQPDGKIVVAGTTNLNEAGAAGGGGENFAVVRLEADGDLDPTFHANGTGVNDNGRLVANMNGIDEGADVALAADGSIYVGGTAASSTDGDFAVLKLTPQGELDTSYDGDGRTLFSVGSGDALLAIAVQPDGKVVATGYTGAAPFPGIPNRTIGLARFTTAGQPDPSFDGDGKRTLDFGSGGEEAHGLIVDSAGRIVLAGWANTAADVAVARLLAADGATDPAFGADGRATVDVSFQDLGNDIAALPDGRVAVAGTTTSGANPTNTLLTVLDDTGVPDSRFGNVAGKPGVAIHDLSGSEDIQGLAAQPDGRLVAVGGAQGSARDFLTARFLGLPPAGPPGGGGTQPPGGAPGPAPPGPDGIAPGLDGLTATRAFAAASRGGSVLAGSRRPPIGGTVRYSASEPVTVIFKVERATSGRRVGRRCVKATRSNRKRRKCTRYVRVRGSFTHQGAAGANSFRFSGRVSNRKLSVGSYRLVAVAEDGADNKSAVKRRNFRIVRR